MRLLAQAISTGTEDECRLDLAAIFARDLHTSTDRLHTSIERIDHISRSSLSRARSTLQAVLPKLKHEPPSAQANDIVGGVN